MFRLHRSKGGGTKSGERIDFKFANIQANQVPKGWDKLFVSLISVETGKTLAKSSKALVRNGSCLWQEMLTESVWIAQDHLSKDLENCSFRFVVAMGSSRSGILGEVTINVTGYIDSITPVPLSLPLKKCIHGTTLQINLHCSAPRSRHGKEGQDDVSSHSEDLNADFDAKSDGSQGSFTRSFGSSSGKDPDLGGTPSRASSLSASDSRRSSISADGSTGRAAFSPRNMLNSDKYSSVTRQDSSGLPSHTPKSVEDSSRSNYSSLSSRDTGAVSGHIALLKNVGSSKSLLEAAENTIDEIRSEANMWERNAQKLMVDFDILKKEFSDQSTSKAILELELSAARTETDGLKKEIRQLELSLEDMKIKQKVPEYSTSRSHIEKGLEDEIKFNRESNSELALQLKKAQESNIELVSILQELEETIETQKVEIQELSDLSSKLTNTDRSIHEGLEESKTVKSKLHILEESEKLLLKKVKYLEEDLKEKTSELETESSLRSKLQQNELEYNHTLADKDDKILNLETKLSDLIEYGCADEPTTVGDGSTNLKRELEALKEKVQELERDCTELTDENLELLFKLKKFENSSEKDGDFREFLPREPLSKSFTSPVTEEDEKEAHSREAEIDKRLHEMVELELLEASITFSEIFRQLQKSFALVNDPLENLQKSDHVGNGTVIDNQVDFEDGATCKEKAALILCDLTEFRKALESHVYANRIVEKKMTELEIRKQDQELNISELERENVQLLERISGLEAQLRHLTNEKESTCMELQKSQHLVSTLQDQLSSVGKDMEQKLSDQKEKMEEVRKKFLEHQKEIEYLNASNSKLQATAEIENLKAENTSLKSILNAAMVERDRLESSLQLMTNDCETLKAEKIILTEKFSTLEKAAFAYEDCKHSKISLEEKILRLEGDMIAKEAACAQDIELKNELGRVKSENRQLHRKIEKLEDEIDQLLKKYQVIEEELKLLKEARQVQNIKNNNVTSANQQRMSTRKASFKISQGQENLQSDRTANGDHYQGQAEYANKFCEDVGSDSVLRIHTLENDLADALEAIHLYKLQLKRLSEGNNHAMTRSKSSLEVELRDIKERYLHMSLKYAEVEAQREELVMKLKAARNGRKWF